MDKTSRLIKWQRNTVATLLLAVVALGYTSYRERQQANVARAALQRLVRSDLLAAAQREVSDKDHEASDVAADAAREAERQEDRQTIDGLEAELARYRSKYGEIDSTVLWEENVAQDVITDCFPDHDEGGTKIPTSFMTFGGEVEPFEPGAFKRRIAESLRLSGPMMAPQFRQDVNGSKGRD
jgi:hypothetical protein